MPAHSWVEHCDWMPFLLTGGNICSQMKRGRCSAGHKALWSAEFGRVTAGRFFFITGSIIKWLCFETFERNLYFGSAGRYFKCRMGATVRFVHRCDCRRRRFRCAYGRCRRTDRALSFKQSNGDIYL